MTGQAHWITAFPFIMGAVGIAWLLWRDARANRRYRLEQRQFLCPDLHRKVLATLVRDAGSGEVMGVRRCSGNPDPETVACGRGCVPGFAPRAVRQQKAAIRASAT